MKNILQPLIDIIAKLPGLGPRSARRIVLHLLNKPDLIASMIQSLSDTKENILECDICRNIDVQSPCSICIDQNRDASTLCVVESVGELWAMERSSGFKGKYHILGGLLSTIDNITPEKLSMKQLLNRISSTGIKEVIIAISATLDGQTTAYYITDMLSESNVVVSRLAFGIPIGAELEYMDEGTLSIALKLRQEI